ncbi:hypothetical protein diail_8460, partial [Diaporthe ilicicola]
MSHCKAVPKNTQGKDYDRSIGVTLTYRGRSDRFKDFNAQYCFEILAQPLDCGAGGAFQKKDGSPQQWWEVKADPTRRDDGFANGYTTS